MAAAATTQYVTWALTGTGIAASLGWNLINSIRSTWIAAELRKEQYKSAQWARIRSRIDVASDGLVDAVDALVAQVNAAAQSMPTSAQPAVAGMIQMMVSQAHDKLSIELSEASASAHCSGTDWEQAANGKQHGTESSWDMVLNELNEFDVAAAATDKMKALQKARGYVVEVRSTVNQRLRTQDNELDPARL